MLPHIFDDTPERTRGSIEALSLIGDKFALQARRLRRH